MDSYLTGLLERVLSPVSDNAPCGENARYDERYDFAKNEIMKMTAGSSAIDWEKMLDSIDPLLSEKTKDLTLAAYLSLVLLKLYEYDGLFTGLKIVDHFVDNWWDTMFPPAKRKKARIQIFEWMDERLSGLISVTEGKPDQAESLRGCIPVLTELPDKVQNLVKAQVTGFSRTKSEINQWIDRLPAPEPEKKPEPEKPKADEKKEEPTKTVASAEPDTSRPPSEPAATSTPSAAPVTTPLPAAASPSDGAKLDLPPVMDEMENIDEGIKAMIKIVQLIRKVDPLNPISYRLSRVLKWEMIRATPPAGPDGKTRIPAPNQQVLNQMNTQLGAGNWPALTQTAEHMFIMGSIFFIDLQRYVAEGLANQGAEEASQVALLETGKLLNRFPELLNFSFMTGHPFADDQTRAWAMDAMKAASGPGTGEKDDEDNAWLKDATKAAAKNLASALPMFHDAISSAKNTKSIMKRQRDVAKFFVSNRAYEWAMPLLESLHEKVEKIDLAQWEPDFCSDVWELLLRTYEMAPRGPETSGKDISHKLKIRQRLFETNVARAAATTPKEKKK